MKPTVILAAPGLAAETSIVAACDDRTSPLAIARRCVDAIDLVAAGSSVAATAAVIGPRLPRLTRDTVDQLSHAGLAIIGLVDDGDEDGERTLRQLDVDTVVVAGSDTASAVARLASAVVGPTEKSAGPPDLATPTGGSLVAVWGPTGAPGRSTVAITLADELARRGVPTVLVDADPYGGTISTALGIWDDTSGIAMACRRAETGALDVTSLAACARAISPTLRVLSGLPRPQRWAELRPASLRTLWKVCRASGDTTVVDCGFSLESDDDMGTGPRRNAMTITALAEADVVIAVGSADPLGVARLVAALPQLAEQVSPERIRLVITRVRSGVLGRDPQGLVQETLSALVDIPGLDLTAVTFVPDDRSALDACIRDGRTLAEAAPRSHARTPLTRLAAELSAVAPCAA